MTKQVRDWQKDMVIQFFLLDKEIINEGGEKATVSVEGLGDLFKQIAAEKERADQAEQRARVTDAMEATARAAGAALIETEAREKKLREALECVMEHSRNDGISVHLDRCYIEARDVLASLYSEKERKV